MWWLYLHWYEDMDNREGWIAHEMIAWKLNYFWLHFRLGNLFEKLFGSSITFPNSNFTFQLQVKMFTHYWERVLLTSTLHITSYLWLKTFKKASTTSCSYHLTTRSHLCFTNQPNMEAVHLPCHFFNETLFDSIPKPNVTEKCEPPVKSNQKCDTHGSR